MRRVIGTLLTAVFLILIPVGAAQAMPSFPDCKADPQITSPDSGTAGSIDPGPANPKDGDPFAKGAKVTIYDVYGWGGLTWPNYDMGCGPDALTDPVSTGAGVIANSMWQSLITMTAITVTVIRFAFDPATVKVLEPIQRLGADAFGNRLFMVLFALTVAAVAVMILAKAGTGNVRSAAHDAGWVLLVAVAAMVAITWPTKIAPAADRTLTGVVSMANVAVAQSTGDSDNLGDAVASNIERGLLYETWKAGMFGRYNGAVAEKYGPDLFKASTLTRAEAAQIKKDPSKAKGIYDEHKSRYKEVAAKIQEADPEAYQYIAGHRNLDHIGYAALAWVGYWCSMPYEAVASLLTMVALVAIRLFIIILPLLALLGGIPKLRHLILRPFDYVAGAFMAAAMFGCFAALMAAAIGAFMSPDSGLNIIAALLLMAVFNVVAWRMSKPMRSIKNLSRVRVNLDRFRREGNPAQDGHDPAAPGEQVRAQPSEPSRYAGAAPAESSTRVVTRTVITGAVQGAVAGATMAAVTGGGSMLAGAASGAGRAAVVSGAAATAGQITGSPTAAAIAATGAGAAANRAIGSRTAIGAGPTPAAAASPAATDPAEATGPVQHEPAAPIEPPVRLYTPGEVTPADHLTPAAPTGPAGEETYTIYTPSEVSA